MRSSIFFALFRRAAVLILVLLMATAISAQITPSDDSYISSALPTTNYGTAKTLNLSSAVNTAFIRFDLTAVPAGYTGASIAKATLKLYVNTCTKSGSFNVDLVNGTWAEKTITYSLQPALGTTIAASVPLTTSSKLDYIEIDITPAVVDWLNGTENDGIALVANSPLVATFDSKENTTTSHPPELDIVFTSGSGGGTITGVLTGAGSGLTGGGTSGTLNLSLLTSCASGQVLAWNGSAWVCTSLTGGGTITGVIAGTDLTGGGTSGTVTLNLDITKVPQLAATNTFTANQTVNGSLSATSFNIATTPFAFGTYSAGNAFLGFAGNSATTGTGNTASGYRALAANSSGNANTATGNSALSSDTTGGTNTADGNSALYSNTTGAGNTASGISALYKNTTGGYNTADGNSALSNNTTGSYNTALGYNAGPDSASTNLTNATAIGANAMVSQSNSLVLGNAVNVGIGTAKPTYTLDVQGSGRFTQPITFAASQTFPGTGTITGVTAGTDLIGGGTSGNVTLNLDITKVPQLAAANTFTGNQTVNGNLSATGTMTGSSFGIGSNLFAFGTYSLWNAFLGFAGSAMTSGGSNTAVGYKALAANTTGVNNTASGTLALYVNTTGAANTASGVQALYNNTTASYNTASGYRALLSNTTGDDNTASGYQALLSNTTGYANTASGADALYYNTTGYANTASGTFALASNTTANSNTASGYQALFSNTTGDANTASGYGALNSNTTGYANAASGTDALYSNTTGYANSASGYQALSSNTTGNYLTCVGALCSASADGLSNATAIGAHAVVGESNALVLGGTGTYAVRVGIGTATPSNVFTIAQGAGHAVADGWDTYSSRRWKTNIHTLHDALAKVEQLRGVSYDLKANGQHEVGVIAEEVGAVVPEVVTWEKNGKDAQSVDYGRLTALLIEATKEQQALIREQKEQIRAQQAQIVRLTREVKTIQAALKATGRSGTAVRTVKAEGTTVRQ